jgi:hypothetical protein
MESYFLNVYKLKGLVRNANLFLFYFLFFLTFITLASKRHKTAYVIKKC